MSSLEPNAKELKVLQMFVSRDAARPHLCTIWHYASEGGDTYVATDGHTMLVRRSGTHRTMTLGDIEAMAPSRLDDPGAHTDHLQPPRWARMFTSALPKPGRVANAYGIDPNYVARVGDLERAAGARASEDFVPRPSQTAKDARAERAHLARSQHATWSISSDPLDPWVFRLDVGAARWDGLIMPRRT